MKKKLITLICACLLLVGCYSKPVRHLASDAAMIKPGQTTFSEVQQYLGEPKGRREVGPGVVEYVYSEDEISFWGKMPYVGSMVSPKGFEMIVLTVKDGVVTSCEFHNSSETDSDWANDYYWD